MKSLAEFLAGGEAPATELPKTAIDDPQPEVTDPSLAVYLTKHQLALASYDAARLLHVVTREKFSVISAQQVRAAIAILDRTGFGPSAELKITDPEDLEKLSDDQLLQRIDALRQFLLARRSTNDSSVN